MALNTGYDSEIKATTAKEGLGVAADELLGSQMDKVALTADSPMRMHAAATPDTKLYFSASRPLTGNGSAKSKPAIDDKMPDVAASTIDLTTAATTGATFQVEGASLSLPAGTTGQYRRFAFALRSTGEINIKYSAMVASLGSLDLPETLFNGLDGDPIGWIDLEYATTTTFKTAGSATTVIENSVSSTARIVNISGGGSGGGAKMPMRIQAVSGNLATISGGTGRFPDSNEELANYDGAGTTTADFAKPQSINLDTILGTTPTDATTYYLYWDRDAFAAAITLTDADGRRAIVPITQGVYKLFTTPPTGAINRARYVYRGTLRSATTGNTWSGTGASFSSAEIPIASVAPVSVSPVVYHASQAVGAVGSSGQIAAGHVISSKSWSSLALAANRAWFNFTSAAGSDGSGNARDLTANNAPSATTGIMGSASSAAALNGTTQTFSSTNAFYKPSASESYFVGGWFAATDWTPAGTAYMVSTSYDGTNIGFSIILSSPVAGTTRIDFRDTTDGTNAGNTTITVDVPELTAGSWHHIGMRYDATADMLYAYIDGVLVGSTSLAKSAVAASHILRWGARLNAAQDFFAGSVDEGHFAKGDTYSDADIRRLFAYRLDHNKDVAANNQRWSAKLTDDGGCQSPLAGFVVCQGDKDSLFVDFSGQTSTAIVDLVLDDLGISATVVPAGKPFDATYSANPTWPIAHGLGPDVPVLIGMQEVSAGVWQPINLQGTLKIDGTNISEANTGDFNTNFPLSGSTRVRLVAFLGSGVPTAVLDANASRGGLISSAEQIIPGNKIFAGAVRTSTVAKSANYTILDGDGYQTFVVTVGGSTITMTLPLAANNTGRLLTFKKSDTGAGKITLARSGSDTVDGATSLDIGAGAVGQNSSASILSDGTTWLVVGQKKMPSSMTAYTPGTVAGFGSPTGAVYQCMRVEDEIHIFATFTTGTVDGTTAEISLPTGLLSTSAFSASGLMVGRWYRNNATGTTRKSGPLFVLQGASSFKFSSDDNAAASSPFTAVAGNGLFGNTELISLHAVIPLTP